MEKYNQIMIKVWLFIAIAIFVLTAVMCVIDDWRKWIFYFLFAGLAFLMHLMKKWMVKRMNNHVEYMSEQSDKK